MNQKRFVLNIIVTVVMFSSIEARAQQDTEKSITDLDGVWTVQFGFGEIPVLSGSFKPSISFGYHINEYIYVGWIVQLRDVLERGEESFNAVNTGLGGIVATREETGVRSVLEARFRPHRYSPYLSLGVLFNGSDTEMMQFDDRTRKIGKGTYSGEIDIEQTRPWGINPAIGIGYGFIFNNGVSLSLEMLGAFFFSPPDSKIRISASEDIAEGDRKLLIEKIDRSFSDNFHNRYHLFNIGAGYAW